MMSSWMTGIAVYKKDGVQTLSYDVLDISNDLEDDVCMDFVRSLIGAKRKHTEYPELLQQVKDIPEVLKNELQYEEYCYHFNEHRCIFNKDQFDSIDLNEMFKLIFIRDGVREPVLTSIRELFGVIAEVNWFDTIRETEGDYVVIWVNL